MVKAEMRLCLSDDDHDGVFDHLLTATISHAASPVGLAEYVVLSLLQNDDLSYQAIVLRDDSSKTVHIPYKIVSGSVTEFEAGPAVFRDGDKFALGIILGDGHGNTTTIFDPEKDGIIKPGDKVLAAKRPKFSDMRPLILDNMPRTVEVSGSKFVITSVDIDSIHITLSRDFGGTPDVPIAYQGGLLEGQ